MQRRVRWNGTPGQDYHELQSMRHCNGANAQQRGENHNVQQALL